MILINHAPVKSVLVFVKVVFAFTKSFIHGHHEKEDAVFHN